MALEPRRLEAPFKGRAGFFCFRTRPHLPPTLRQEPCSAFRALAPRGFQCTPLPPAASHALKVQRCRVAPGICGRPSHRGEAAGALRLRAALGPVAPRHCAEDPRSVQNARLAAHSGESATLCADRRPSWGRGPRCADSQGICAPASASVQKPGQSAQSSGRSDCADPQAICACLCLFSQGVLAGCCGFVSPSRPGHGRDTDTVSGRVSDRVVRRRPAEQHRQGLREGPPRGAQPVAPSHLASQSVAMAETLSETLSP